MTPVGVSRAAPAKSPAFAAAIEKLLEVGRSANVPFSVAGGINSERIEGVESAGATIAVAGAAIYGAKDPGAAAKALREKIQKLG